MKQIFRVAQGTLGTIAAKWSGEVDTTPVRHFVLYETFESELDGTIVRSILCVETGKIDLCPPWLPLSILQDWLRSNFAHEVTCDARSTLS